MTISNAEYVERPEPEQFQAVTNFNKSDKFKMAQQPDVILEALNQKCNKLVQDLVQEQILERESGNNEKVQTLEKEIIKTKELYKQKMTRLRSGVTFDPLKFYCPNGAQERMIEGTIKGLRNSTTPVVLLTCGNGVGKTTYAVNLLLNIVFGPQNGWFDYPEIRNWKFPKLCWYVSTADAISETVTPMIEELAAAKFIKSRSYDKFKDGKKFISKITTKDGWTIIFRTYDQDPGKFESAQVGLVILDEPAPESIWNAIKSRRRKGCLTVLPMTPLYTPPYIVDEVQKAIKRQNGEGGYQMIEASVYEASMDSIVHGGVRGHLNPKTIDEMVESYSPDEREARVYGKVMYYSGRIYPQYSDDMHVINPQEWPIKSSYNIYHIVDPHDSRPCACGYLAVTPPMGPDKMSKFIFFAETPDDNESKIGRKEFWEYKQNIPLKEEVSSWKNIERKFNLAISYIRRIMDKRFGWQSRGRRTFYDIFAEEHKIFFEKSYDSPTDDNELLYGHREVQKLLAPDSKGVPNLLFYPSCVHLRSGMRHYIKRRRVGKSAEDKAAGDGQIVEKYKDFPDIVRYGVCGAIAPRSRTGKTEAQKLIDMVVKNQYLKKGVKRLTYKDL